MIRRLAVLVAFSVLAACTSGNSTGIAPISCPPGGSSLTYANFGQAAIEANCLRGCHETKKPQLTTQAQVQAHAGAILDEAVYTDAMPQNRDMTIAEREMLGEWLACGAP